MKEDSQKKGHKDSCVLYLHTHNSNIILTTTIFGTLLNRKKTVQLNAR